MPELILAGKLYRAVAPLFGIKNNRGNRYFATKIDFTNYIHTLFSNKYAFTDTENRRLKNSEASAFFIKNMDYKYDLEMLSNIFAVDPYLLEVVLFYISNNIEILPGNTNPINVAKQSPIQTVSLASKKKEVKDEEIPGNDEGINEELVPVMYSSVFNNLPYHFKPSFSIDKLRSVIKKSGYRYVEVQYQNDTIIINGLVNSKYQYFFINDNFINSCMNLLMIIKINDAFYYKIDGQLMSLYSVMNTFESLTPNGLTRYKGLGEQDPKQLAESVLRPDSDRVLVRYTIDSIKEEIESFRYIDSYMATLINQSKITRQDIE